MYVGYIDNNQNNMIFHYPSANQEDPHVGKLELKESISSVSTLTFTLYPDNPTYNYVFEIQTKVKVVDLRDNTVRFAGRILTIEERMDNDGKIYKNILAESIMAYLNDSKQRGSSYIATNATKIITDILNDHNSKVDDYKKIYPGSINITSSTGFTHSCEFDTTLSELSLLRANYGGEFRVEERNGKNYLDWLTSFDDNVLEITLGVNMKEMVISKDVTNIGTRIIPLGANNLTIESVNSGKDYIQDDTAVALYGIIEKTVEYRDIENASELKQQCTKDLHSYTQAKYVLTSNALDLSYLSGNKAEQFKLGVKMHIVNQYMNVNDIYRILEMSLDLLTPYNPSLTIANTSCTLSGTINDIRSESIQNDGVYNNVQIGRSFGIRCVRSDNKAVTTINATEGISIENQNEKVFYVDMNGQLVAVDIQAEGGTFVNINAEGGTFDDITAKGGIFDDITCTNGLTVKDGDVSCMISNNGIAMHGAGDHEISMTFVDPEDGDGEYKGMLIDGKLKVTKRLRVEGEGKFYDEIFALAGIGIKGELSLNGNMKLKNDKDDYVSLKEYINEVITEFCKDQDWELK